MGFVHLYSFMNSKSLGNYFVSNHQYFEKIEEKKKKIGIPKKY